MSCQKILRKKIFDFIQGLDEGKEFCFRDLHEQIDGANSSYRPSYAQYYYCWKRYVRPYLLDNGIIYFSDKRARRNKRRVSMFWIKSTPATRPMSWLNIHNIMTGKTKDVQFMTSLYDENIRQKVINTLKEALNYLEILNEKTKEINWICDSILTIGDCPVNTNYVDLTDPTVRNIIAAINKIIENLNSFDTLFDHLIVKVAE